MIDTHCHILPGTDDGPKTEEGALKLALSAVEEGIETVIATPHHRAGSYRNKSAHILRRVKSFNHTLKRKGIPLTVLPGQEYRLTELYRKELKRGHLQTLAGSRYMLIELPSRGIPEFLPEMLDDMESLRLRVVIAHPERNASVMSQPRRVIAWLKKGALLQVTTPSLAGFFGPKVQETALLLCREGWAHLLGTDAHDPFRRKFFLNEGCGVIKHHCGAAYLDELRKNAEDLIGGRDIATGHSSILTQTSAE